MPRCLILFCQLIQKRETFEFIGNGEFPCVSGSDPVGHVAVVVDPLTTVILGEVTAQFKRIRSLCTRTSLKAEEGDDLYMNKDIERGAIL